MEDTKVDVTEEPVGRDGGFTLLLFYDSLLYIYFYILSQII